jgi:hypothetical protein
MAPKGKPMKLRNKQRTAGEDAIDRDLDDFLQRSEEVLLEVLDALENASVDPLERKILWADGARLSIEDTARRIHAQSGMPLDSIESHVVGWLEMTYEPQGLNEYQMEEFELLIEQWITPYDDPL